MQAQAAIDVAETVVVAMSGGVDSAATALLLQDLGHSVIGISMQVWDYREHGGNKNRATCCAPADFDDARVVAERYEFPFYVFDFEDSFEEKVIEPFVKSYLRGETPNPCLECNRKVKFRELRQRARTLGASVVATGHYAQIRTLADGSLGLFTGRDCSKDQSYFLYAMTQDELAQTYFPVGSMEKSQVRAYLAEKGLKIASKAESQDICFVNGSVGDFIKARSEAKATAGSIVSTSGSRLGLHDGIENFTVGQRRGLGVSSANPLYVLNINADNNQVTVGEKEDLEQSDFLIGNVSWISGRAPTSSIQVLSKLRYRHPGVLCDLELLENNRVRAVFSSEWTSVSPGQAAVFYSTNLEADGARQVLGGGIIEKQ